MKAHWKLFCQNRWGGSPYIAQAPTLTSHVFVSQYVNTAAANATKNRGSTASPGVPLIPTNIKLARKELNPTWAELNRALPGALRRTKKSEIKNPAKANPAAQNGLKSTMRAQ